MYVYDITFQEATFPAIISCLNCFCFDIAIVAQCNGADENDIYSEAVTNESSVLYLWISFKLILYFQIALLCSHFLTFSDNVTKFQITILVAAGGVHKLPSINNSRDLKEALQKLASIPSSRTMVSVQCFIFATDLDI